MGVSQKQMGEERFRGVKVVKKIKRLIKASVGEREGT